MNIQEIKRAVDHGDSVHWSNKGYLVIKDMKGQYLITFASNDNCIGLTNLAGDELNGEECDFFIGERNPNWDRFEFTIAQHFLPAIINDDFSGIADIELRDLRLFIRQSIALLPANCDSSHWAVDVADCTNFARCEVSNLLADVADIALVFKTKESE